MNKIFGRKSNPYFNHEAYPDPTPYHAIKSLEKEESEINKQIHNLMHIIKAITDLTDFEIVGRIELKHKKSGKIYK